MTIPRRKPAWSRPLAVPFTPQEDEALCQMVRVGLSCDYWQAQLPGRTFGELLERRMDLIDRGVLRSARPI
ncbi:hypothetical protein [Novosphingobium huizhouense]|uniref:hypothetical protein n=1 Tax=Novosphingobium huizhouense TaxID=2866625 RepID=UPI001CD85410|nr:hypothetical protein [Novosphingobium huizhouense]